MSKRQAQSGCQHLAAGPVEECGGHGRRWRGRRVAVKILPPVHWESGIHRDFYGAGDVIQPTKSLKMGFLVRKPFPTVPPPIFCRSLGTWAIPVDHMVQKGIRGYPWSCTFGIYIYLVVSALWWMAHLSIFEPYPHGWYTDTRVTDWSRLCGLGPGEKYHGRQLEALATFTSQTIGNLRWYPPKKGCIYPYLQVRNITFEPFSFFCILLWIPTV